MDQAGLTFLFLFPSAGIKGMQNHSPTLAEFFLNIQKLPLFLGMCVVGVMVAYRVLYPRWPGTFHLPECKDYRSALLLPITN